MYFMKFNGPSESILTDMQKILNCSTAGDSLREAIDGWGDEDGDKVLEAVTDHGAKYKTANKIPVGLIRSPHFPNYPTVLHAIGDGWKLLAPPVKFSYNADGKEITGYSWWLVKD